MYRDKKISLVIPAYNEQKLISRTLAAVPQVFDRVFVVDDASTDQQNQVIEQVSLQDRRIKLLKHTENQGPGGAIITGYKASLNEGYDVAVVVGGDHQMDLSQIYSFLDPIINDECDYAKGNRFLLKEYAETVRLMPKVRFYANWLITLLTKIASGYFKIMDVVDGYTAINRRAIETINWDIAWKKYGYPMDFLVRLNAYGFRVKDVPRTAIYTPGERQSQIKGFRYAMQVTPMLIRDFIWRLRFKYMYRSFHPLVFFYFTGIPLVFFGIGSGLYLIYDKIFKYGFDVTGPKAILVALALLSGFQFILFAMLFDMQESGS